MPVSPATFVPPIAVAHVLGLLLLLYSLEQLYGLVSRGFRAMGIRLPGWLPGVRAAAAQGQGGDTPKALADAQPSDWNSSLEARQLAGKSAHALPGVGPGGQGLTPAWTRGCDHTGPCACSDRWVALADMERGGPEKKMPGARSKAGSSLVVKFPADLAWSGLTCSILDKHNQGQPRHILHPSSGAAMPGEMLAIVGPSGAGKSTLLDILAQRKGGTLGGTVLMNGSPLGQRFKACSAYVPQEDVHVPTLSAWETMEFHSVLRSERGTTAAARRQRMTDVLSIMGLWRVRDTQVGGALAGGITVRGLSGGETRRLSIACGLIGQPSILFLDEPTTGLDSFAALNCMDHMSCLAALGHTIIASVHQPRASIWELFHKVTVLSEGYQVYFGPPSAAIQWFEGELGYTYDPEAGAVSDWLMDLVSVGFSKPVDPKHRSMTSMEDVANAGDRWQQHTRRADTKDPSASPLKDGPAGIAVKPQGTGAAPGSSRSRYASSWATQYRVLTKRALLAQLRNPTDVTSRLLLSCYVGMLAGLTFFNLPNGPSAAFQRLSILFFIVLLFELLPFCYMSFYVADRKFFATDVAAGLYHKSAYYLAQTTAGTPFIILNTLCGSLAAYGLAGLRPNFWAVIEFAVIIVLQSLIAIQLMILCVYLTPNQDLAFILATGYVAISILLTGFWIRISAFKVAPLKWLSFISYPRWALQGVSRIELKNERYATPGCVAQGLPGATADTLRQVTSNPRLALQALNAGFTCVPTSSGDDILRYWQFTVTMPEAFAILMGFYLVLHALSYAALALLYRQKR